MQIKKRKSELWSQKHVRTDWNMRVARGEGIPLPRQKYVRWKNTRICFTARVGNENWIDASKKCLPAWKKKYCNSAKANENYCSLLLLSTENIFYLAGCRRRFSMPFELAAAERLRTQTTKCFCNRFRVYSIVSYKQLFILWSKTPAIIWSIVI